MENDMTEFETVLQNIIGTYSPTAVNITNTQIIYIDIPYIIRAIILIIFIHAIITSLFYFIRSVVA
jgi:hypothetical protein